MFTPTPLNFAPGVTKDRTRISNQFGYWDADLVRWVEGFPQTIGGWQKALTLQAIGAPRALFGWHDLDGIQCMGVGTYIKYYVETGGTLTDITPLRRTAALGANPITTSSGSGTITVADAAHGANAGEYVELSGSTDVNGITAAQINTEHVIVTATTNTYTVATVGTASGAGAGGGAGVTAEYQIAPGLDTTLVGGGYGAGTWGRGTWDSASAVTVQGAQLRVWTQDNWGEDLVYCPRYGVIYYYDRSSPDRGVDIATMGGATDVPTAACQVLTHSEARHLLVFGATPAGGGALDEMVWRWGSAELVNDFDPTSTNSAGGNRLLIGSKFLQAVKTRQEIVAFTDRALYAIQYVGSPDYFSQRLISPNVKMVGPKAAGFLGDSVFWMDARGFNYYNGAVQELPCPLKEYVFRDINLYQLWKTHCAVNSLYDEVWWFYCSAASEEIDRYVMIKIPEGYWANGTLPRTAWLDNGVFTLPRAADEDGYIYDHETGSDADGVAMTPHIESSPFAIGDGSRAMRIKSLWPDIDFLDSDNAAPEVSLVLKLQDKPGTALHGSTNSDVIQTSSTPVQVFTDRVDIGKRGRFVALRVESAQTGLQWRVGPTRIELRPDGRI